MLAVGAFLRARGPAAGQARRAILEGRRHGRHAAWILGEDPETLLFEPLEAARARLRITPPVEYEKVPVEQRSLVEP